MTTHTQGASMAVSDERLLPCPFCGGPAEIVHIDEGENSGGSCVWCTSCFASGDVEFGRKENFVDNWNRRTARLRETGAGREDFQSRVAPWMQACFGPEISADTIERNHRFLEEALELVQSLGCMQDEAHQLVDYVYGRPQGDVNQEVGGVMVTLAALCLASGLDMHSAAETELARIWTKVEQIRAKQASKPKHSPLPATLTQPQADEVTEATHRHKKRGTEYVLIGIGKMQAEGWVTASKRDTGDGSTDWDRVDMREVAVYRPVTDPTEIWVRPRDEFEDGRFEALAAMQAKSQPEGGE